MKMNKRNQFALLFVLLSCLLTCTDAQFRMINGQNINIEISPHSVAIFHYNFYIGVGSLVNLNSVVTTAHCLIDRDGLNLVVLAGVADKRALNRGIGQQRNVVYIHQAREYNPRTKFMDVAVVKVDRFFKENNAVKPILLCSDPLVPGSRMQISGWGAICKITKVYPNLLQTKFVQIANTQQCKTAYANRRIPVNLAETIICAGRGGEDLCSGDSGAGGVLNGRLCAVAQGGCGVSRFADLYTNVSDPRVLYFIRLTMNM